MTEDTPEFYRLVGVYPEEQCEAILQLADKDGVPHTYYRARSTPRWVLYRRALSGWGAAAPDPTDPRATFDPRQR
jgi:hypothetical protein